MKISVVIPNYNGFNLIKNNLPHVISSLKNYGENEVIVVDDGSSKIELDRLEKFVENYSVILVKNKKNEGFSSAVNKGVEVATGEYVVLLNTDVKPYQNFLDPILNDFKEDPKLFGVGCLDESEEKGGVVFRGRGLAYWKNGMFFHKRGDVDELDTFWISGGSSIVKRSIFIALGGFDSLYNPFYWEDIDISFRAVKSGYNLKFNPKSRVIHRHDEGSIRKNNQDFRIKVISFRNQFIFIWKNISDFEKIISHILFLPYYFIRALFKLDFAFYLGFLLALFKIPDIIFKRFKQKKLYKRTDRQIFSDYP